VPKQKDEKGHDPFDMKTDQLAPTVNKKKNENGNDPPLGEGNRVRALKRGDMSQRFGNVLGLVDNMLGQVELGQVPLWV